MKKILCLVCLFMLLACQKSNPNTQEKIGTREEVVQDQPSLLVRQSFDQPHVSKQALPKDWEQENKRLREDEAKAEVPYEIAEEISVYGAEKFLKVSKITLPESIEDKNFSVINIVDRTRILVILEKIEERAYFSHVNEYRLPLEYGIYDWKEKKYEQVLALNEEEQKNNPYYIFVLSSKYLCIEKAGKDYPRYRSFYAYDIPNKEKSLLLEWKYKEKHDPNPIYFSAYLDGIVFFEESAYTEPKIYGVDIWTGKSTLYANNGFSPFILNGKFQYLQHGPREKNYFSHEIHLVGESKYTWMDMPDEHALVERKVAIGDNQIYDLTKVSETERGMEFVQVGKAEHQEDQEQVKKFAQEAQPLYVIRNLSEQKEIIASRGGISPQNLKVSTRFLTWDSFAVDKPQHIYLYDLATSMLLRFEKIGEDVLNAEFYTNQTGAYGILSIMHQLEAGTYVKSLPEYYFFEAVEGE